MSDVQVESAIPGYLAKERTQPLGAPSDYQPPVSAYASRFSESITDVVVAILGAQHESRDSADRDALMKLTAFAKDAPESCKPVYWLLASNTDGNGAYNETVIAYWTCKPDYDRWLIDSGFSTWWTGLDAASCSNGWFKEVLFPPIQRLETVFSDNTIPEGVAYMHERFSGPIREHVYWGSMRDRLPASQQDALDGVPWSSTGSTINNDTGTPPDSNKTRIRVPGRPNLAIIRSGQDWSTTTPEERKLYLETLHPVLITGMTFLRDEGHEVGCISNRFMQVLNATGSDGESSMKTFGLGFFDDLNSLEGWSKKHKTHLDIFGRFMRYAQEMQGNMSLRLFHEVLVLEQEQQDFEYIACHPQTGMLASL